MIPKALPPPLERPVKVKEERRVIGMRKDLALLNAESIVVFYADDRGTINHNAP